MSDAQLQSLLFDLPEAERPEARWRLLYATGVCGWIVLGFEDGCHGSRKHADDILCMKPDGEAAYLLRAREIPEGSD